MRLLVSLEGRQGGFTREALAQLPHDRVHVLAVEPESEETDTLRALVERSGATFEASPVPTDDLLGAFGTIRAVLREHEDAESRACQVNAGKDANLLSAAGLLACLHEGVPAHFVHERGHTPLAVLTPAPLEQMLEETEQAALARFPQDGVPVQEARERDAAALNGLKKRGLIALEDGVLKLTPTGEAYQEHVLGRRSATEQTSKDQRT